MPFTHFTDRHAVQLLATQSRRTDLSPVQLARSHVDLGRLLAYELVELLPLESCQIQHPQGVRTGVRIERESEVVILSFLRAGLYVTEGVREVLQLAAVYHVSPTRESGLDEATLRSIPSLAKRVVIIVDSVINTGTTLLPVLEQVRAQGPSMILVLSLVTPVDTAKRLEQTCPDVHFLLARVSTNQYTGVGVTDTGNRLFGTLPRREDAA